MVKPLSVVNWAPRDESRQVVQMLHDVLCDDGQQPMLERTLL